LSDFDEDLGWIDEYTAQHDHLKEKSIDLEIRAPVYEKWYLNPSSARIVKACLKVLLEEGKLSTVRHLFYRLVGMQVLKKHERYYRNILVPKVTRARKAGLIPMEWIIDESREVLEVPLYDNIQSFLAQTMKRYYRNTWRRQLVYVMVWVEKAALQNAVWNAVGYYNIPVFPGKGYDSWPHFLKAVKKIKAVEGDKIIIILYLGDHDPSGMDMPNDLQNRCKLLNLDVRFERVAVTQEQIKKYNIPKLGPLPTITKGKRKGEYADSRAPAYVAKHGDWFVELDALSIPALQDILRKRVTELLDMEAFKQDEDVEWSERKRLLKFAKKISEEEGEEET